MGDGQCFYVPWGTAWTGEGGMPGESWIWSGLHLFLMPASRRISPFPCTCYGVPVYMKCAGWGKHIPHIKNKHILFFQSLFLTKDLWLHLGGLFFFPGVRDGYLIRKFPCWNISTRLAALSFHSTRAAFSLGLFLFLFFFSCSTYR